MGYIYIYIIRILVWDIYIYICIIRILVWDIYGCFYKLGAIFVGVIKKEAYQLESILRPLILGKLPHIYIPPTTKTTFVVGSLRFLCKEEATTMVVLVVSGIHIEYMV